MHSGFVGTFFSHVLSLISTIWAIFQIRSCGFESGELQSIHLAFALIFINCCLALIRYGNSESGYKLRKLHVATLNISTILSFTIIEAVLLHIYKSSLIYFGLSCLNIIPFMYNILKKDYRTKFKPTDGLIAVNGAILLLTSLTNENYNGAAFTLSYLFGYFVIGDSGCFFDTELPSVDAFQYLQCFLNFFIISALCD